MKLICIAFFALIFQISYSQSLSPERVAKIKEATVRVTIGNSIGTGFFINSTGTVVTCFHVIQPGIHNNGTLDNIFIELNTGEIIQYGIMDKIALDSNWTKNAISFDYCILVPIHPNRLRTFPFLKLGNFDDIHEGDEVYTCGYPIGIKQQFISKGIVSTKYTEDSNKVSYNNNIFTVSRTQALLDITLNRGNSGGPIIKIGDSPNDDEVIGIADFIITPAGSQSEEMINLLLRASGGVKISGVDPNYVFAQVFSIISSLSIGVSGCISINHLVSWLVHNN
ncbi:MAG: S1 family peptidase [Ginsengibacter sp.]